MKAIYSLSSFRILYIKYVLFLCFIISHINDMNDNKFSIKKKEVQLAIIFNIVGLSCYAS